jgi:hypothetical protein
MSGILQREDATIQALEIIRDCNNEHVPSIEISGWTSGIPLAYIWHGTKWKAYCNVRGELTKGKRAMIRLYFGLGGVKNAPEW